MRAQLFALKALQHYSIPFTGLKTGKHQFEYEVDKRFFNEFEHSIIKDGRLHVSLVLEKQEIFLVLQFHIRGEIKLSCDVCLADYPSKIDIEERLIVKFGGDEDWENDTEEVIILTKKDHEIDVSLPIYEYINLAAPYVSRCDSEGNSPFCDQEMIAKLKALSGKQKEQKKDVDPRWDALKKIQINKN